MATAKRTTREITTTETVYTLELSEAERQHVMEVLRGGAHPGPLAGKIHAAMRDAEQTEEPTPLAVGDRVRVLRGYGPWLFSEVVEIRDPNPDSDNEIFVRNDTAGTGYLPADGEGTVWERVTNV